MTLPVTPNADRVESFVAAIDGYEPKHVAAYEDTFRVFARFISRSIDARYLERHPSEQLLQDIEHVLNITIQRQPESILVDVRVTQDASGQRRALLTTCMADQGFIYSIVRQALTSLGIKTLGNINSVVPITRDAKGQILTVGAADAPRESFIWLEIDANDVATRATEIMEYIRGRLEAAHTLVNDFNPISQVVLGLADRFDRLGKAQPNNQRHCEDSARLLRWLLNEHFVFLGTRYIQHGNTAADHPVGNYGIGRLDDWRAILIEAKEQQILAHVGTPPYLWIYKSQTESWAYRPGRTDHVVVQCFDANNQACGILVMEGVFSYPALAEPRTSIPVLDGIINELYTNLKAIKGSHRYRTIRNAFNSLPLEYLFSLPKEDIFKLVEQVLDVDIEHRSQIHIKVDTEQNTAFVFVALPRASYSDELRSNMRRLLKDRFKASSVDDGVYAGHSESVTLHFFLIGTEAINNADKQTLEQDIDQLASPWSNRLNDGLIDKHGLKTANYLYNLYTEAFPNSYREETPTARAVADIDFLEATYNENRFDCDIYTDKKDRKLGVTCLRMFHNTPLLLSDILPILDNFGLVVMDQFSTTVHVPGRSEQTIATFRIGGVQNMSIDLSARQNRLRNAICAVVAGAMSNDPLNRLLLRADIPYTSVVLILAYQNYARQLGLPYVQASVEEALLRHADIVRSLCELFRVKFDPEIEGLEADAQDSKRLQMLERTRRAVLVQFESVDDLTSDQVLRTIYNLIEATVRTNFYARDPMQAYHVVLKFDPQLITRMPEPRPFREIYVYHPQMVGLHLRGGSVARGGIRWSDRLLDFRTEVLGLMVTQNLKNVLIVPRGAKGAYVLRQPSSDFAVRRTQADEMYKIFIRGLLDVTDNLVNGQPVTPPGILHYEDKDHYLVVAADKGTAHLSDTANLLAAERQFWLGDAFASGGSQGYDHKKEAITSRGAWACVRRHFHEMGVNPEQEAIKVIGIGDMSGDVFGNGMLRSSSMQLVAAFDHRHIFIDPNPDAAASFKARRALFEMPRSSWEDYPKAALSHGAGIYPRSAKSIKLSSEARAVLGIGNQETLSAPELVQAILCAPVDLLWNGGIGTYIKASHETHVDVGDQANDNVRVDATEVRAKVIGEGGNLGITAAGRIELAARGIRLNTDAVDNSAGVDLSDHEVNLKILFQTVHERVALKPEERNEWLSKLRVEVGNMVVHNNWLQSRMLSLDELRSKRDAARFLRALSFLAERTPYRLRDIQSPIDRLARLHGQKNEGFYRPELAFLAANAKLDMRQELGRASDVFTLERLQSQLFDYFPESLTAKFAEDIRRHPLAIYIARTMLTNQIMADVGCTWLAETSIMTGRNTADIIHAYLAATDLLQAQELKRQLNALESKLEAQVEYNTRLHIEDALEEISTWLLRQPHGMQHGFKKAFAQALTILPTSTHHQDDANQLLGQALRLAHATPAFVATLATLGRIGEVLDIAQLTCLTGEPVERVAMALRIVGDQTGLLALLRQGVHSHHNEDLDKPARFSINSRLRNQLLHLSYGLLNTEKNLANLQPTSTAWLEQLQRELAPLSVGNMPLCNLVMAYESLSRQAQTLFGQLKI